MHCIACALPAVAAGQGAEQTFDWSLDTGVQHSDNIERSAVNEESQTVGIAGVGFQFETDRPRLDADIGANLQYRDYLDDAFRNELVGGVDAVASYAILPSRLVWVVMENFGQVANERQLVETPDNRQNVNYFTTGPDIAFALGARTDLRLSGRVSDIYYENTPEDSRSTTGSIALIRPVSERVTWSLNGSTTEVEYDEDQLFSSYEINEGFVRVAAEGLRTTLAADAGYTVVDRGGESSDGLLARLELSRAVATRSRVGLQAGTEFTTTADAFRRNQTIIGIEPGNDSGIAAGDAFRSDYAFLTWNTDWERGSFSAVLNGRKESHETETILDRELYGAIVRVSRQVSRRLNADLFGSYADEDFSNRDFRFDEWTVGLGLRWRFAEQVSLRVTFDHSEGSSSNGTRDYEENRAYVGISYSRRGS